MPYRPPSLRAIAAFEAAARHESFAKAADELNLTQSAISHSIRGLEERLGGQLFGRSGRNVVLTQEGRRLANRVRLSLSLLTRALDAVDEAEPRQELGIGVPPEFAARILSPRLHRFFRAFPYVKIRVIVGAGPREVQAGDVDLAVVYGGGSWIGLSSHELPREEVFPVGAPEVVGAARGDPAWAPLIEMDRFPWALWFGQVQKPPAKQPYRLVFDDWALALQAARDGLGVCLATPGLAGDMLSHGELARLGHDTAPALEAWRLAWKTGSPQTAIVSRFAHWMIEDLAPDAEQADRDLAALWMA